MRWTAVASAAGLLLLAPPVLAQADPVGIWNLESRNMAERATGGVRHVILKVERVGGELTAQMTSPRNTFLDVDEFTYDAGHLVVFFGAYEYDLMIDGDRISGTLTSPVHELAVTGHRQEGVMYGGDEPAQYVATRTGVLGNRDGEVPPEGEADPGAWMRSRVDSAEDVALVLRGIPVLFVNAEEFADELMSLVGRRVDVTGEWVGERYRIHEIGPAAESGR